MTTRTTQRNFLPTSTHEATMMRGNDDGGAGDVVVEEEEEEILVLFASQTGNSEQAAQDIAQQIPHKLSPEGLEKLTGAAKSSCSIHKKLTARHMQLDNFLEIREAPWTRLVVIVLSSYGVGQSPLGGYRFRDLCDHLLEQQEQQKDGASKMLDGMSFCLLGLGDSMYTTFLENPTTTHDALVGAGATLIGTFGKADASDDQLRLIADWIDGMWPSLAAAVLAPPTPSSSSLQERLKQMQQDTMEICYRINPDLKKEKKAVDSIYRNTFLTLFGSILVAILAFLFHNQRLQQEQQQEL